MGAHDHIVELTVIINNNIKALMTFRILQDHSLSTGVQSYALETLQEKIQGAEDSLRRELDNFSKQEVILSPA